MFTPWNLEAIPLGPLGYYLTGVGQDDHTGVESEGYSSKALKQAVRRNIDRFPSDFMFEMTKEENQSLRSQNVTLKRGQHSKYLPFVFTEQGVAMFTPLNAKPV